MNKFDANLLFDAYGSLLTKRQQEILKLYYQEDLSYTEISEELQISRQSVMDSVHRGLKLLEKFEENIKFLQFKDTIYSIIDSSTNLEQCKRSLAELLNQ
ncbi:YlxM family DNA-binding protein [Dubosiella newyorkensis]|jgi:predicted DNA-binding protein YlxM (UPF0122 family)|uniref:Uncharacterized protein n=2 Tax=Dubosiella newyorkensis TaxID=1862672 RepID=A0A1U7NNI9_9FIRM|nr:sigma factor-like helix-turn-helix DNA-binding protein [Dubosiella newyorkensis]MCI9041211.1 DNA-binding protein [Dubosiella newyorkensis]OLU46899.1 hypothetical protein BO225_04255 [Dubosiella newyorkensis]